MKSRMDYIYQIIKGRSTPGVIIFDEKGKILYSNEEAVDIVSDLNKSIKTSEGKGSLKKILILLEKLKKNRELTFDGESKEVNYEIIERFGKTYSARAFFIGNHDNSFSHIMVLLEKIIERHQIDFEKVKKEFSLSQREIDVLKLISEGLNNREISERLFISEYTVKDHIKKIMMKMRLKSRGAIIASLK